MTKLDYSRRYTRLTIPSDLPKATPISRTQRRAYAKQRRELRKQHKLANQPPEQRHAQHPAVVAIDQGHAVLWCRRCRCCIVKLTQEEYEIWRQINPPRVLRAKSS
jgi:hypothetical protein